MKRKRGLRARLKKGAEGAVSLLLVLSIIPFFSMMAAIVESERYQNAVKALDEALGSSALSTLSEYDSYMLKRFGLLAVKQTTDEDFISGEVEKYLRLQNTTDLIGAGVGTAEIKASGVYALADTAVLRQQVTSYANVLSPAMVALDFAELDELVKQIEKAFGVGFRELMELISSGSGLASSALEVYDTVEEAEQKMDDLKTKVNTYQENYTAYVDAMEALEEEKGNDPGPPPNSVPNPGSPPVEPPEVMEPEPPEEDVEDEDGSLQEEYDRQLEAYLQYLVDKAKYDDETKPQYDADKADYDAYLEEYNRWEEDHNAWVIRMGELRDDAANKKNAYASSVSSVESGLNDVYDKVGEAQRASNKILADGVSFAASAAAYDSEIEDDADRDEDQKKLAKNLNEFNKGVVTGYEELGDTINDRLDGLDETSFHTAMAAVQEEKRLAGETDTDDTINPVLPGRHTRAANLLTPFQDKDKLLSLMNELEENAESGSWLDMLLSVFDVANALFDTKLFVDGELSVTIDVSGIGGLPSARTYEGNAHETEDDEQSRRFLREIDPDYSESDPFGLTGAPELTVFELLIRTIQEILSARQTIHDAHGFRAKLGAFRDCLENCGRLVGQLQSVQSVFKSITSVYERFLIMSYMVYNLPNRTNYDSGKTLTGYKYSDAALADRMTGTNIPLFGEILAAVMGHSDYSFNGAELEYIVWGSRSEMTNQFGVFMMLYILRLFADIFSLMLNQEVVDNVEIMMAVPIVGQIAAAIYVIILVLLEPLIDMLLLVNGQSIPLIKLNPKNVFLTSQGMPHLLEIITKLDLTESKKQSTAVNLQKGTGGSGSASLPDEQPWEKIQEKYLEALVSFDYGQYLLLIMMIFGNEEAYLNRLKDLIQMEGTYCGRVSDAKLSHVVSGDYVNFSVDRAYTTIRIEAAGALQSFLPIPVLNSGSGRANLPLQYQRVIYRGY